jgi:hypothetical protein
MGSMPRKSESSEPVIAMSKNGTNEIKVRGIERVTNLGNVTKRSNKIRG